MYGTNSLPVVVTSHCYFTKAENNNKSYHESPSRLTSARCSISQELISDILQNTNCSLKETAASAGIPYKTLRNIYTGIVKNPTVKIFSKILRLYCQVCQRKAN